jgi:hypothetical protein
VIVVPPVEVVVVVAKVVAVVVVPVVVVPGRVVVTENERAPAIPVEVMATARLRKSLGADVPPSLGAGGTVAVPR